MSAFIKDEKTKIVEVVHLEKKLTESGVLTSFGNGQLSLSLE